MVKLEIRNLETSKSHLIDPGGAIIGREGGDAQIKLPDQGVSKKHARIYAKRGTWYLEDLDSANGTYLEEERITSAVTLTPGSVFTMSRQQFEVVQIVTEEPEATRAPREDEEDAAETNAMEPGELPDRGMRSSRANHRRPGKSNVELRRGRVEDEPPPTDHSTSARVHTDPESEMDESASAEPRGRGRGGGQVMSASRGGHQEDSEVPAPSFASFAGAIPRSIGYYLKTAPLMAVNPLGTIKKGIAEQPLPALSPLELIAYAIPAQLAVALVGAVCAAIVGLVAGAFSVMLLFPIVPLAIAVVAAGVGGFIAHPVLTWVVDKLGGQSDARSRSNFFVMAQTATILMALPSGLAALLSLAARVPFLNLLPPVLSLVATLVMVYLAFSWFRYFGVVQWFEYALLGLGLLACLGAAWGLVGAIGVSVRTLGSRPATAATGGGEAAEALAAAEKRAAELAAAGDSAGAARVMQEAALAASKAGAPAPEAAPAPGPDSPTSPPPPPEPEPTAAAPPPPADPPAPEPAPTTPPPAPAPPPAVVPAVAAAPAETRPASGKPGKLSYPDYRVQREAIEKAIREDPTVLRQGPVLAGYERLLKETKAAEAKFKPRDPREPHMAAVNARLKEVAVYDATADAVADLYARMFKR